MTAPQKSARSALPGTGKLVECPACGRRLVDRRSLRQHVAAAHPASAGDETGLSDFESAPKDLPFTCNRNAPNRAFR